MPYPHPLNPIKLNNNKKNERKKTTTKTPTRPIKTVKHTHTCMCVRMHSLSLSLTHTHTHAHTVTHTCTHSHTHTHTHFLSLHIKQLLTCLVATTGFCFFLMSSSFSLSLSINAAGRHGRNKKNNSMKKNSTKSVTVQSVSQCLDFDFLSAAQGHLWMNHTLKLVFTSVQNTSH